MSVIDTHAHLYHSDEIRYPMIPEPSRPDPGIGTIEHLRRNMAAEAVTKVVLVQTGSAYLWDNSMMADAAIANAGDMTGVCNLDPRDPRSPEELIRLAADCNIRGLRLEPGRGMRPAFNNEGSVRLFRTAREIGVIVCAHLHVELAGELSAVLEQFPEVPVVLDHSAYLYAKDRPDSERVRTVCNLARYPNLYTKLTFGITGSHMDYPFTDTHENIRAVIGAFGPDRCMWGSDFPCEHWLKKATYSDHLNMFRNEIGLSSGELQSILSDTAGKLWFNQEPGDTI